MLGEEGSAAGAEGGDDGGGEAGGLHGVEAPDGKAAGGGYFVDLGLGMGPGKGEEGGGPFEGLDDDGLGVGGAETELDSSLD